MTGPLGFIGYIKLTVLVDFFFSVIFLGGISLLMPLDLMLAAYFSAFGTITLFLCLSFEVSIRFDFSWDIVEWLADGN